MLYTIAFSGRVSNEGRVPPAATDARAQCKRVVAQGGRVAAAATAAVAAAAAAAAAAAHEEEGQQQQHTRDVQGEEGAEERAGAKKECK